MSGVHVLDVSVEEVECCIDQFRLHERAIAGDPDQPVVGQLAQRGRVSVEHIVQVAAHDVPAARFQVGCKRIVVGVGGGGHDHDVDTVCHQRSLDDPVDHRVAAEVGERLARQPR